uniref:Dienelactone hydrolase domain-containing protein n=1 Tax=Salix viminalis TaxID=40686 RepID=A0A6N2LZ72_SALVM
MSGPRCCANPPTLNPSSGAGHVEKVGGLDSYVSGSPDSKLVILLVSDIYDKIAAAGFYAVVPDFFMEILCTDNAEKPLQDKGYEDAKPVIEALNSKGVSAIGAVGFCWGAKVVVELGKSSAFIKAAVLCHPALKQFEDVASKSEFLEAAVRYVRWPDDNFVAAF